MREIITPAELAAAKSGNETALAAIIARYMNFIRRLARLSITPGLDFDDAVQEGLIGLFSAIERYEEGRGAAFNTYAAVCIKNSVLTAQKAAGRKKHSPLNYSVPIPAAQSTPGPEEQAIQTENLHGTLERMRKTLSPFELEVLNLSLAGYSQREIALKLGRQPKAVENALVRLRRKLRNW